MANIDTYLQQIKTGVYGKDVRNAIHDAIKAVNQSIPTSTNVAQEVISARTPGNVETPYSSLKQRLDAESESLMDYVDEKVRPGNRAEIQINNATVGYSSLKDRLDSDYENLYSKLGKVDEAVSAAEEAVEAASVATSKATEATNAANTAASKATQASNAASSASSNAQVATNRASQASTSASDAASSAYEAVAAAQQAQQAAQSLVVDDTLTQQGKPADAKKVGDELSDLKGDLNEIEGFNEKIKRAILALFNKVAFFDEDEGRVLYNNLYEALYGSHWNSSDGRLTVMAKALAGSPSGDDSLWTITESQTSGVRACVVANFQTGDGRFVDSNGNDTEWYPIPVPSDATGFKITLSEPSESVVGYLIKHITGNYFRLINTNDATWHLSQHVSAGFTSDTNLYLGISIKKLASEPIPSVDLLFT